MLGLQISATGMQTALRRQDIAAHNIANVLTPGFRAVRADSVEVRNGDIGATAADNFAPNSIVPAVSDMNLGVEMVNTIINRNAFQANLNAFRSQAELIGNLLDLSR